MSEESREQRPGEQEAGRRGGYAGAIGVAAAGVATENVLKAGVLAGLIGGVAEALWLMISAAIVGVGFWAPLELISTMVLGMAPLQTPGVQAGAVLVGAISHFVIMGLLGGLFGLLVRSIATWPSILLGLIYGLTIWVIAQYVTFPLIRPDAAAMINPATAAISLALYGVVLGWLYAAYLRRYSRP